MSIKKYSYTYSFSHIPPIMRRGTHALAVLMDQHGNYVLGGKDIYPQGIYRLIGGGVNTGESPINGLLRELEEETGLTAAKKEIAPLAQITSKFTDSNNRSFTFYVYLFKLIIDPGKIVPSTDLDRIKIFSPNEMVQLITKYSGLSSKLVHLSKIPGTEFRWSDYGKYFAQIHQIALDLTRSEKNDHTPTTTSA